MGFFLKNKTIFMLSDKRKKYLKSRIANPPKKLTPEERKYIGAVKGGLKRHEKALRVDGKFTNNDYRAEVVKIATAAGVNERDLQRFYEQDQSYFENLYKTGRSRSLPRGDTTVINDIKKFKGTIYVDRGDGEGFRKCSKEQAIMWILEFKTYLSTEHDSPFMTIQYEVSFDRKMYIRIPSIDAIEDSYSTNNYPFEPDNLIDVITDMYDGEDGYDILFYEQPQD